MTIWQDANGGLHDDMDGAALNLPDWPQGMTALTPAQVASIQAQRATTAAAAQAALPDPAGFSLAIKTALGGIEAVATLPASIQPIVQWFYATVQAQNWPDVQTIIIANKAALDAVNAAIYKDVKAAAAQFNIPVTL